MTVRTRMAPSPTGEYHIGHIRTLLYDYALAKKHGGQFILRIEDTDQVRLVEGALEKILQVIKDYGLTWDEGPEVEGPYAPYIQSQRLVLYREYALDLVAKRHAYFCFCTKERLDTLRSEQQTAGKPPRYDKKCLSLSKEIVDKQVAEGVPYVIRLNIPKNENIEFEDVVYGKISFDTNELSDTVLLKSDGFPTYHLAVVVDDYLMKITHILRGNDWLPSAPIHILLYKFFGWQMPVHAHLPNLKEKEGTKKLSKRFGPVAAAEFLKDGYLPEALLNFLMYLGWNPGTEKEIYSLDEFIKDFSLERVHKTDLVAFDREKLLWLNGHYIREMSVKELWEKIKAWSDKSGGDLAGRNAPEDKIIKVLSLVQERMKMLSEFNALVAYFFEYSTVSRDLLVSFAHEKTKEILQNYVKFYDSVSDEDWQKDYLDKVSHDFLVEKGYKPKEAFMTLRVAVSGVTATPPIFDTLEVLGKNAVIKRINDALKTL